MDIEKDIQKTRKNNKRGVLLIDDRKYQKVAEVKNGWRVKCTRVHNSVQCNGRGRYLDTGELIQKEGEYHSDFCCPIKDLQQKEEFLNDLRRDVSQSSERPRRIHDRLHEQSTLKYSNSLTMPYSSLKNVITRSRRQSNPPQPKNLEELGQLLKNEKYCSVLNYDWKGTSRLEAELVEAVDKKTKEKSFSVVFGNREWSRHVLKFIEDTVEGFSDGTFNETPSKIKTLQLFKFGVSCFYRGAPLAYALMERKSEKDYHKVIECIVNNFAPELRNLPIRIHLDFEAAERNGWELVLPSAQFVTCFFHWKQIQWRWSRKLRLFKLQREFLKKKLSAIEEEKKKKEQAVISEVKDAFMKILEMPLLPLAQKADQKLLMRIVDGLSDNAKKRMLPYSNYFQRNWLSAKQPPEKWNVSEQPIKTNNFSETGNRLMHAYFSDRHPSPWALVRNLVAYHKRASSEFDISFGKADTSKEKAIAECTNQLLTGKIGRIEFLHEVAKLKEPDSKKKFSSEREQLEEGEEETEEREYEEEVEEGETEDEETDEEESEEKEKRKDEDEEGNEEEEEGKEKEKEEEKENREAEGARKEEEMSAPSITPFRDRLRKRPKERRCAIIKRQNSASEEQIIKRKKQAKVRGAEKKDLCVGTNEQERSEAAKEDESVSTFGKEIVDFTQSASLTLTIRKRSRKQVLESINREGGDLIIEKICSPNS